MPILVTVNETAVTVKQALNWSVLFDAPTVLDFAIEHVAVAQEADRRGYDATAEEVSELFTELRYMRRLEAADAMRQWMADNHLDLDNIRLGCELAVKRRKLRDSIPGDEIAGYYAENRPQYERAEIYRICVDAEATAREIRAQIVEEEESFCLLAVDQSTDRETAKKGGYVGEIGRADVSGEIEAAVFGAQSGDVVGPVKTALGWQVILIHDARRIGLEAAAAPIRDILFQEIVTRATRRADVIYNYAEE